MEWGENMIGVRSKRVRLSNDSKLIYSLAVILIGEEGRKRYQAAARHEAPERESTRRKKHEAKSRAHERRAECALTWPTSQVLLEGAQRVAITPRTCPRTSQALVDATSNIVVPPFTDREEYGRKSSKAEGGNFRCKEGEQRRLQ